MRIFRLLCALIVYLLFATAAYCQCKTFAGTECVQQLTPFVHEGIFHTVELSEGESTELFRTLYANQNYRIAVCSEAHLPKIKFTVMDSDRNVLFTNVDTHYTTMWDFTLNASQQLIIAVEVETVDDAVSDEITRGCVAVIIGVRKQGAEISN